MVTFEIKDGMIFDNECDSWIEIQEFLQMIINQSAEVLKSSATLKFVSASNSDGNPKWFNKICLILVFLATSIFTKMTMVITPIVKYGLLPFQI